MFKKDRVLSIEITPANIRILEMTSKGKGKIIIHNFFEKELQSEIFDNGKIVEMELLKNQVNDILNEEGFKSSGVVFTLDSSLVVSRDLMMPVVNDNELENMIRFEIEQYLPINLDEYVIQYKKMELIEEGGEKKTRMNVSALPKNIVENYLELARGCELEPLALDLNFNAIAKVAEVIKSSTNIDLSGTIATVDVKKESLSIYIFKDGVLKMNRYFPSDWGMMEKEQVLESIRGFAEMYSNVNQGDIISKIYFYGEEVDIEYFREAIDKEISIMDKINNIKLEKNEKLFEQNKFMNCIGAGLRKH